MSGRHGGRWMLGLAMLGLLAGCMPDEEKVSLRQKAAVAQETIATPRPTASMEPIALVPSEAKSNDPSSSADVDSSLPALPTTASSAPPKITMISQIEQDPDDDLENETDGVMSVGGPAYLEGVPLIPREVLLGNPDKAAARISPDGKRLSFLAPVEGVLNVWVGPADDPSAAKPITHDTNRGIRVYFWAYTSQDILYMQDTEGDENWHVYRVNLDSGDVKDLTPYEKVAANIDAVSHKFPKELLIGMNDRDEQVHDIYRVNIDTGERKLVEQNDDAFVGYITDDDFNIRFAMRFAENGGQDVLEPDGDGWKLFVNIPMEDDMTTSIAGFDKTGDVAYLIDSRGRDTGALTTLDLKTGEQKVIASSDKADVGDVLRHTTENTVQAVSFTHTRKQWQVLDPTVQADFDYLQTVADGELEITSSTLDESIWTVAYLMDNGPVRFYLYYRDAHEAKFLFTSRAALEKLPLVKMHPLIIPARDGLELVSYLSLPPGVDLDNDGVPKEPVPMVLDVHGGPWARDDWGYNAEHQLLANRGYAVLAVNFRGSTGFGKAFINAGNKEWAGKMHDDLIDAVKWCVDHRIADAERVGIMGGSYGGYATLVGLTFTPDLFACGVDIVGPSNIQTLLNTIPAYWQPAIRIFQDRVGDFNTEEGKALLQSRSPLNFVDKIQRPLLIGQGANDPRVKQSEAQQVVDAMVAKKIPVTYVLYPDEGHGFARPQNRLSFNAVTEAFLSERLGGRYQPIGDDFQGSSITVPVGAEFVPGVETALDGRTDGLPPPK